MTDEQPVPRQLGNYDILSEIAKGGMGTVYKARNRSTGEVVAVKVIAPATAKNPVLLQRFEREFMAARVLDHPNVVKALDYSGTLPHPFLVMEFVDGQSIGQRLEQKGAYPEAEAIRLIAQVCDGLQRAHKQGLVHRDVKPDNILVTRDGTAKLTDMGLVREVEGDLNLTRTGRGLGTPHYMAPEQFRNAKTVDVRGDIYSLGATLYAMVTATTPFDNASPLDCWMKKIRNEFPAPKELNPALSDRIDWAIRRAMSAEPAQRPASCREFVEDLTGQSRHAPPPQQQQTHSANDVWYLVYRDETDKPHTVKGSTEGIRNALRDNLLGDPSGVLVSRTKHGQFSPLSSVPEFRDLVVTPGTLPVPGARPGGSDVTAPYAPAPGSGRMRPVVPQ
ncbi:MAG: serine/threonine protein kinase, partial [Gemmataceae bacterium]|nr:serine/threonine protein kinase [Gemmataceae bacterium]